MRRDNNEAAIAVPVVPGSLSIKSVPGSYWPFRSFPILPDVTANEFERFLAARDVKRALGYVWRIGPIYLDDPVARLIESTAELSGWRLLRRRLGTTYQVDFCTVEGEAAWPRKSTLKRNRKLEHQMARLGPIEWVSLRGAEIDVQVLDELAALEAKSWQGQSRDAKFLVPSHRRFWEGLIADPTQADRLCVHILRIDGKTAAWRLHLEAGAMVYGIATSYDPKFAKFSPGICLATRALSDARYRGFECFDRGSGDSGSKQHLGAGRGPEIVDCLLIRGPLARIGGSALGRFWRRHESHKPVSGQPDMAGLRD